ncbi:MAG: TonB-dependent receptor, partial [Calditrichaeota bacterium]
MTQKKCLAVVILLMIFSFVILPKLGFSGTTGKIVGNVTDVQTGEALVGTNVVIDGTTMGAATDVEGDYFIINVPPGSYKVSARMMGYITLSQTQVNVSIDHTTRANFQLQETILETGESVTVVAERPLVERDETSTRHFVQAEEIAARPANNLSQILSTMPGIDQSGGELVVRRGTLDQVAFLIDGMRARNPLDFQPYQNVNLTSIQELEIITGGFSAEYGEAQSGIFNIVTKEGSDKLAGYGEFRWTPPGQRHWGSGLY